MPALEIAERPQAVETFLEQVEESDEDERENALLEIGGLVQFSRRFYIPFFAEELDHPLKITGFLFRDKRKVARTLVEYESDSREQIDGLAEIDQDEASDSEDRVTTVTDLAELYEDLVDALQGDLDFGYSSDIANFREFHNELYPTWLESLGQWVRSHNKDAEKLEKLARDYRDVAAT